MRGDRRGMGGLVRVWGGSRRYGGGLGGMGGIGGGSWGGSARYAGLGGVLRARGRGMPETERGSGSRGGVLLDRSLVLVFSNVVASGL